MRKVRPVKTALPETERTSAQTDCRADHGNPEVISRECLDFMIPLGEKHLRRIVAEWVTHYNQGRPHLSLGPGIPERAAYSHRCKITTNIPFPKTAKLWLAWFSAACIASTGGKGSPREGREEFRRRCT